MTRVIRTLNSLREHVAKSIQESVLRLRQLGAPGCRTGEGTLSPFDRVRVRARNVFDFRRSLSDRVPQALGVLSDIGHEGEEGWSGHASPSAPAARAACRRAPSHTSNTVRRARACFAFARFARDVLFACSYSSSATLGECILAAVFC